MPEQNQPTDPLKRLLWIMERLRGPGGCPWDREQTHESIKPQLIEECYEVIDAIESGKSELLREELGDVLLHVIFHAQLAREAGCFDFDQVAAEIGDKLIRRHPHVFGDIEVKDSEEVLKNWNEIKKKEKPERTGVLDGIPRHLPALMRAQEVQKKAARVGFDWPEAEGARKKVDEELAELEHEVASGGGKARLEDELGDLYFALVNYTRHLHLDAEQALSGATSKFIQRFVTVEKTVQESGREWKDWTLEELDKLWDEAKRDSGRTVDRKDKSGDVSPQ